MQIEITHSEAIELVKLLTFIENASNSITILIQWDENRDKGYNILSVLNYDDIRDYATKEIKLKENQELKTIYMDSLGEPFAELFANLEEGLRK